MPKNSNVCFQITNYSPPTKDLHLAFDTTPDLVHSTQISLINKHACIELGLAYNKMGFLV